MDIVIYVDGVDIGCVSNMHEATTLHEFVDALKSYFPDQDILKWTWRDKDSAAPMDLTDNSAVVMKQPVSAIFGKSKSLMLLTTRPTTQHQEQEKVHESEPETEPDDDDDDDTPLHRVMIDLKHLQKQASALMNLHDTIFVNLVCMKLVKLYCTRQPTTRRDEHEHDDVREVCFSLNECLLRSGIPSPNAKAWLESIRLCDFTQVAKDTCLSKKRVQSIDAVMNRFWQNCALTKLNKRVANLISETRQNSAASAAAAAVLASEDRREHANAIQIKLIRLLKELNLFRGQDTAIHNELDACIHHNCQLERQWRSFHYMTQHLLTFLVAEKTGLKHTLSVRTLLAKAATKAGAASLCEMLDGNVALESAIRDAFPEFCACACGLVLPITRSEDDGTSDDDGAENKDTPTLVFVALYLSSFAAHAGKLLKSDTAESIPQTTPKSRTKLEADLATPIRTLLMTFHTLSV